MNELSNTDALMWFVEDDPLLRSTIVGVFLLDATPDWDRVVERLGRISHELPILRHRVVRSKVNPGHLHWEPVPDFDLSYHLRRVRVDGDLDAVFDLARTGAMAGFDRSRPLWEFTLVDGLPEGRSALITKLHHVVTDGVGSVQLAAHVFDFERHPALRRRRDPVVDVAVPDRDAVSRLVADLVREVGHTTDVAAHQLLTTLPHLARVALRPRRLLGDGVELARSIGRTIAPTMTTLSPVMTGRSTTTGFHGFDIGLDELKQAGKAAGGTLNDAFLAGITGGLRRYHEHHGVTIDRLRVAMPISLRDEGDAEGGNHVTILRFEVPAGLSDPAERVRAMDEVTQRQRHEASLPFTDSLAGVLNLLPNALIGSMMRHVDFLASNVPGTPWPMYLEGARIERYYPFGPTAGAALNVTLMSYVDRCCIGVNLDRAAVPDPDRMIECLRDGFDEVLALGRVPA